MSNAYDNPDNMQQRALQVPPPLPLPSPSYYADLMVALHNMYDSESNPTGHIPLCVAENKLMPDLLMDYMCQPSMAQAGFGSPDVYGYHDAMGLPEVRKVVAEFLDTWFVQAINRYHQNCETAAATRRISPDHVMIGTGVASVISMVLLALEGINTNRHMSIGSSKNNNEHLKQQQRRQQQKPQDEEFDAILIPAPYYAAFDRDVSVVARCRPVPVTCTDPTVGPSVADLQRANDFALLHNCRVKFLLLTNPHNPLGVVYAPHVMRECLSWARQHGIHTLVDEVYALSVFDSGSNNPFQSVLQMLDQDDLSNGDVHFMWGVSKDFAASGFRIGILYTQNIQLLASLSNLNSLATVPHPMQRMVTALLNDTAFCHQFLNESRQRLVHQYRICTEVLDSLNIPYVPAQAGMFVYVNLSSLLPTTCNTQEDERKLARRFVEQTRIVLTPGFDQHDPQPGWFRLCYAYVPEAVLVVALERLRHFVVEERKGGNKNG